MDETRKGQLSRRLDELAEALEDHRLSFAKSMAIIAGIVTALASLTTIAAEGQAAITHILQLIGQDKDTEAAAQRRLAPAPRALPAPERPILADPAVHPRPGRFDVIDDDIPF